MAAAEPSPRRRAGAAGPVVEPAPVKVNLCLHVTGRRADGYHELDSLVVFGDIADEIRLDPREDAVVLRLSGPPGPLYESGDAPVVPPGTDNLVWRALAVGARRMGGVPGMTVTLTKRLPPGAGLGGGSSDAAAVLRALARLAGRPALPGAEVVGLGADVPMCLDPRPWRARGIGERLTPLALDRDLPAVLVWPGRALSTAAVFGVFAAATPGGTDGTSYAIPDATVARFRSDPIGALRTLGNALTDAACRVEPAVAEALAAVAGLAGCRLARMSGSGSAVIGLFDEPARASAGAALLAARRPAWWVRATSLRAGGPARQGGAA